MADPVVTLTNGIPTAGSGNITTLGQTLLDGANATIGITTGAAVTTSVAGTIQGYLRGIVSLLVSGITVLSHAVTNAGTFAVQNTAATPAGTNVIGHVIVDTAPSTAVTNAGTFAVQAAATLNAETTKVIGVTRTADGTGNLITSTSGALDINIKSGGGSGGTALADEAAFTEGTTSFTPIGGTFKTSQTPLTTGQAGAVALSAAREMNTLGKLWDGTTTLPVLAASSGAPAATSPALPVSLRDMLPPGATISATSAPVNVATDQATLAMAFDTSQILNGKSGVSLTPTKVKISVSTATTTTLVALVASKKIRILSLYLVCAAADTITFQSHTTTTNSDGGCSYAANGGISLPFNPIGWFDTTAGEALDMVTSASGQVSGQLTYVAV